MKNHIKGKIYEVYCESNKGEIQYKNDNFSLFIQTQHNTQKPTIEDVTAFLGDKLRPDGKQYYIKGIWENDGTWNSEEIKPEDIIEYR